MGRLAPSREASPIPVYDSVTSLPARAAIWTSTPGFALSCQQLR